MMSEDDDVLILTTNDAKNVLQQQTITTVSGVIGSSPGCIRHGWGPKPRLLTLATKKKTALRLLTSREKKKNLLHGGTIETRRTPGNRQE